MTTKNIVFTRFNTSFDPNEDRFQRCVGNEDWWLSRLKVIEDYFLQSLYNQNEEVHNRLVSFADQIPDYHIKFEVEGILKVWRFDLHFEKCNRTKYHDPYKCLINQDFDTDYIRLICIDSDDMIRDDYVERINDIEPRHGQVIMSEGGYFYGTDSGKLVRQSADKASEVFCKDIPTDVLDSEESYLNYLDEYNLDLYNNELHKADKIATLSGYNFMQTIHDANDTTDWDNEHTQKRIEDVVRLGQKKSVLERFGIDEQSR